MSRLIIVRIVFLQMSLQDEIGRNGQGSRHMQAPETQSQIRRGTYNHFEEDRIGPEHRRAVSDLVRKARSEYVHAATGSKSNAGPKSVLMEVANNLRVHTD